MDASPITAPAKPPAELLSFNPLTVGKSTWRRLKDFSREVWNDHDFWIRALAVKGGASAIIIAGAVAVSYVVAMPFLMAATAIAGCIGLIAIGVYGMCLGAATAWDKLKQIYAKTFSTKPLKANPPPRKPLSQKLLENKHIKHLAERPFVKKFLNCRVWQTARRIAKKQQDYFLTGMAGGGSVFLGTLSALTLVAQIVVLPVVAIGSLLTLTTAVAAGGVVSGAYGIYLSVQKLGHSLSERKKAKKEKLAAAAQPQRAPPPTEQPAPLVNEALTPAFDKAAEAISPLVATKPAAETNPLPTATPPKTSEQPTP